MGSGCCSGCDNSALDKTDLLVPSKSKKLSLALQHVSHQLDDSSEKSREFELKLPASAFSFVPPQKQDSTSARDYPCYDGYLYRTLRTGRSPIKQWAVLTPHSISLYQSAARTHVLPTRSVLLSHVHSVHARQEESAFVIELLLLIDLKHLGDAKRLRPSLADLSEIQTIAFSLYSEPCFLGWCEAFQSIGNLRVNIDLPITTT